MSKLKKIIAKVLEIPAAKINDETSPVNTPAWDSFNSLMLVSALEREYGVHFTMTEVVGIKCAADLKTILTKHGVKKAEI